MNPLFLKPPGISSYHAEGNSQARIGDEIVRNARMLEIKPLEEAVAALAPLPISIDVVSSESPYFSYFTYCDLFGGVLLQAGSVEICARITAQNQTDGEIVSSHFDPSWAFDKYGLQNDGIDLSDYDKVFFTPGSNLLHVIDPSILARLSDDESWYVKPHPIIQQPTLIDYGRMFGYNRVFSHKLSGHALFASCQTVATTQASEFFILAGLCRKQLVDVTKYQHSWSLAYQQFGVIRSHDVEENYHRMNRALMHPNSGWIHPSMSPVEIDMRISRYFKLAMELRKPFKMVSSQRLMGRTNAISHWDPVVVSKQGPRLPTE